MKAISLFSGAGGFELGFSDGIQTVLQVESDRWCQAVLRYRFPRIPLMSDVADVRDGRRGPPIDLIYGGFPCQDASPSGRRHGLGGMRTGLWHHFRRIASEARPRWLLFENVPGLLSVNGGDDFRAIIDSLTELGYGVAWRILDAQFFGVPHPRRRLFAVGYLGDSRRAGAVLALDDGSAWDPPSCRQAEQGAAVAAPAGTGSGSRVRLGDWRHASGALLDGRAFVVGQCNGNNVGPLGTQRAGNGGLTGGVPFVAIDGNATNASLLRRFTIRERERLLGWPDDWTALGRAADGAAVEIPEGRRYHMTGNGVASPVARWIGRCLVAAEMTLRVRRPA